MGATCTAKFRTEDFREEGTSFDFEDASEHIGVVGRGLILPPEFFIVEHRFIPEPNNYAALDRLDLSSENDRRYAFLLRRLLYATEECLA